MMKKVNICTTLFCLILSFNSKAQIMFENTFGGTNIDAAEDFLQTADSGFVLVGRTTSLAPTDKAYVIRTDKYGNKVWDAVYDTQPLNRANSIVESYDGGYVIVGDNGSQAYMLSIDSVGNFVSINSFSNHERFDYIIRSEVDTSYIIAGKSVDALLLKVDRNGNPLWQRTYSQGPEALAREVIHTNDGGYALFGIGDLFGAGTISSFFIKTDNSGTEQFRNVISSSDNFGLMSGTQTPTGEYLASAFKGNDFYIIKYNSAGDTIWTKKDTVASNILAIGNEYIFAAFTQKNVSEKAIKVSFTDTAITPSFYNNNGTFTDDAVEVMKILKTSDGGYAVIANIRPSNSSPVGDIYLLKTNNLGYISVQEETVLNSNIKVFPNPTSFEIKFIGLKELAKKEDLIVRIYNSFGQQVYISEVTIPKSINVSSFKKGVYILQISNFMDQVLYTSKVEVQ